MLINKRAVIDSFKCQNDWRHCKLHTFIWDFSIYQYL